MKHAEHPLAISFTVGLADVIRTTTMIESSADAWIPIGGVFAPEALALPIPRIDKHLQLDA